MAQDSGYSWVVLVAATSTLALQYGLITSGGILYVIFLDYFHTSPTLVSLVISINIGTFFGINPIVPFLIRMLGCRGVTICGTLIASSGLVAFAFAENVWVLCFTYGLAVGGGCGLCLIPSFEILNIYFKKRKATALTLASVGTGLGPIVLPPLIDYLTDIYGWRGAVLICCGVYLHSLVGALLFRPNDVVCDVIYVDGGDATETTSRSRGLSVARRDGGSPENPSDRSSERIPMVEVERRENGTKTQFDDNPGGNVQLSSGSVTKGDSDSQTDIRETNSSPKLINWKIFRKVSVLCMLLSAMCLGAGQASFNALFPAFVCSLGFSRAQAALAWSVYSAVNVAGRLLSVVVYITLTRYLPPDKPLSLYVYATLGGGVILCLAPTVHTYLSVTLYASAFGFVFGVHGTAWPNVMYGIGGQAGFTLLFASSHLMVGVGCLAGPPIAGRIYETTGEYSTVLAVSGAVLALGGVLLVGSMVRKEWVRATPKHNKQ